MGVARPTRKPRLRTLAAALRLGHGSGMAADILTGRDLNRALSTACAHFMETPKDFESVRQLFEAEGLEPVRPLVRAARTMLPLLQPEAAPAATFAEA